MDILEQKIEEYTKLKSDIDTLNNQKEQLGEEIKSLLRVCQDNKFKGDNYTASIVNKTTFKYTDEAAILLYAKKYNLKNYIKETVNTKALNEDLKKGGTLTEDLKKYYTKSVTESLTVGEVK